MQEAKLNKKEIQAAIAEYCRIKEMSQNELAAFIGINPATISKILNDKWESISDRQWRQIDSAISTVKMDALVSTRDALMAFQLCENAHRRHLMAGLVADTGMGKTTAITAYSMRKNAFYYYLDATISPRTFLRDMLRLCGAEMEGSNHEMLQALALQLNSMESPLVLLDECAKMSERMMLTIHSLRDRTRLNCGMVLAGMPYFKKRLVKAAAKGKTGYGEFLRRINVWQELDGLTVKEINAVLNQNGITDATKQKEFRHLRRFGDLQNEIDFFLMENGQ